MRLQPPEHIELERFERQYPALGRWFRLLYDRFTNVHIYSQTLTPVSVAANTTAEQTFTVAGLTTNDKVIVNKPSLDAGIGIVNVRVSSANTLAITYVNATAGAIVPTSEAYDIVTMHQ